jgi:hypothetical protein
LKFAERPGRVCVHGNFTRQSLRKILPDRHYAMSESVRADVPIEGRARLSSRNENVSDVQLRLKRQMTRFVRAFIELLEKRLVSCRAGSEFPGHRQRGMRKHNALGCASRFQICLNSVERESEVKLRDLLQSGRHPP